MLVNDVWGGEVLKAASGQLAAEYGFTHTDGSRPDVWRYMKDTDAGAQDLDPSAYR